MEDNRAAPGAQSTGAAALLQLEVELSDQGLGLSQAAALALAASVTFTSGLELFLLSLIGLDMQCAWHVSPAQAASLFTLVFLGKCAGEPLWGAASDVAGRRPVIIVLCATTAATAAASVFAPTFTWFAALRFAFGFALPVDNIVIVWLLELLPSRLRGVLGVAIGLCWVAASVAAIGTASWLLAAYGWRALAGAAALPAVVSAVLSLVAVPESPLWMAAKGRQTEAAILVRRMGALNRWAARLASGQSRQPRCLQEGSTEGTSSGGSGSNSSSGNSSLAGPQGLSARGQTMAQCATLSLSLMLTGVAAVSQSTGNLLPQQAAAVHGTNLHCTSSHRGAHLDLSSSAYRGLLLDSLGGLPGLLIGLLIIDRLGRLSSLGWMQVLAVATWAPLLWVQSAGRGAALTWVAFLAQWWYTAALTVNNVWQVEVFPTTRRSLCVALNGIMANLGNVVAPYLTAILVQEYGSIRLVVLTLTALAGSGAALALIGHMLGLETGRGTLSAACSGPGRTMSLPFGSHTSVSSLQPAMEAAERANSDFGEVRQEWLTEDVAFASAEAARQPLLPESTHHGVSSNAAG